MFVVMCLSEKCDVCGAEVLLNSSSFWRGEGDVRVVRESALLLALVETSMGELSMCENCYRAGLDKYKDDDAAEIAFQFGLEYLNANRNKEAFGAFDLARKLGKGLESTAHLAVALAKIGRHREAIEKYEEVLETDPSHVMASRNIEIEKAVLRDT